MNKLEHMLLELKDTSEFMVDLAYSSLLYNNMEIAEEVMFMSDTMDKLSSEIQDAAVELGMSNPEEVAKVAVIVKLQISIMDIADAANGDPAKRPDSAALLAERIRNLEGRRAFLALRQRRIERVAQERARGGERSVERVRVCGRDR